jgi:hypothetical protein
MAEYEVIRDFRIKKSRTATSAFYARESIIPSRTEALLFPMADFLS